MGGNTPSPVRMRWLAVFEPLMLVSGIVQPLAALSQIIKLYLTHSQHAVGQSLSTGSFYTLATLFVGSFMAC